MQLKHVSKIACMGMALALAGTGSAADVVFTGAADNDLANPANWSPSTWTADDTLVISTDYSTFTEAGLRVSADLPASAAIAFDKMPDWDLPVDFGGHALNTATLYLKSMHDDAHRFNYVAAKGGFTGVGIIRNENNKGSIHFVTGVYRVVHGIKLNLWFPFVYVDAGAELVIEDQNRDIDVSRYPNVSGGKFVLDGGRFAILNHSGGDARWQRTLWQGNDGVACDFSLLNGAIYEDLSNKPADHFSNIDVTIRNSSYLATNSAYAVRNTMFFGNNDTLLVENGVFRTAQLYLGKYQVGGDGWYGMEMGVYSRHSTVDFVDSEATFAFAPGDWHQSAGIIVPPGTESNLLRFRGDNSRVTSPNLIVGGTSNTLRVEGGVFAADRSVEFVEGSGNRLSVTGGETSFGVTFGAAAQHARVEIGAGRHHVAKLGPGWEHRTALAFEEGATDCALVISNGTYECRTWVARDPVHKTVGGPESDGVPFTKCPGCRIEFRGTTPKFVVSVAKGSEEAGSPWYALTLGEMIDHESNVWTQEHYTLDNPVRLRYVLPAEGYAEAPCQTTSGQAMLLGGNAEFEFDLSDFTWPKQTMRIPLTYDSRSYSGWGGRLYINVEQLNRTNEARLPVSPTGGKARLELASDGKTLNLVLPGCGGTAILIR